MTTMETRPISFRSACAQFVHRFTMEHVPAWSRKQRDDGTYYAPQFRTDAEWYANTLFAGESPIATRNTCYTSGMTWPLGTALDRPFE